MNVLTYFKSIGKNLRPPKVEPAVKVDLDPASQFRELFIPPMHQRPEVEALARVLCEKALKPWAWVNFAEDPEQNEFRHQAVGLIAAMQSRMIENKRTSNPNR